MTIDEAIAHAREITNFNREHMDENFYNDQVNELYKAKCCECAEEHEQLAEWLEDYKRLLEVEKSVLTNEDGYLATMCERKGYNKAIDDVVEALKERRDKLYMKVNCDDLELKILAEQLKAGGVE